METISRFEGEELFARQDNNADVNSLLKDVLGDPLHDVSRARAMYRFNFLNNNASLFLGFDYSLNGRHVTAEYRVNKPRGKFSGDNATPGITVPEVGAIEVLATVPPSVRFIQQLQFGNMGLTINRDGLVLAEIRPSVLEDRVAEKDPVKSDQDQPGTHMLIKVDWRPF